MKLSKSLLSSIAVGLALATTTTSCTAEFLVPTLEDKITATDENGEEQVCETGWEDCPACGLG